MDSIHCVPFDDSDEVILMPNSDKLTTVTLRLPKSLTERARHLAKVQNKTVTEVVSELLQNAEVELPR